MVEIDRQYRGKMKGERHRRDRGGETKEKRHVRRMNRD
jgi:hypothetical protein